jgi:sulfide:quinone oxidoreductase
LLAAFAERGIGWHPGQLVRELDAARKVAVFSDGSEMPYDLFLGVPVHKVPPVVAAAGLTVDGWIPVDSLTLETTFPDVYAVGDVTSVGTPKAGVFAEGQAGVVADRISARIRGAVESAQYDGRGMCYLEFGHDQVAIVDVTFLTGQQPVGGLHGPSRACREQGRVWLPPDRAVVRSYLVPCRTAAGLALSRPDGFERSRMLPFRRG